MAPALDKFPCVCAVSAAPTLAAVAEIVPLLTLIPLPTTTAPAAVVVADGSLAAARTPLVMSPAACEWVAAAAPMAAGVTSSEPPVPWALAWADGGPPPKAAIAASVTFVVAVPAASLTGTTLVETAEPLVNSLIFLSAI
jgi:hypothetical protein